MLSDNPVNEYHISDYQIDLIPMDKRHQAILRNWRNQDEIRQQMLSQDVISEEQQHAWFQKTQHDPKQLHWVVRFRDTLIGATNVKSLEMGKSAPQAGLLEPGLYIGDLHYQGNIIAFAPTLAMYDYCFKHFATKRFRAVVKRSNQAAMTYNQKLGYQLVEDGELCILELRRADYEQATLQIRQFLSRNRKANK